MLCGGEKKKGSPPGEPNRSAIVVASGRTQGVTSTERRTILRDPSSRLSAPRRYLTPALTRSATPGSTEHRMTIIPKGWSRNVGAGLFCGRPAEAGHRPYPDGVKVPNGRINGTAYAALSGCTRPLVALGARPGLGPGATVRTPGAVLAAAREQRGGARFARRGTPGRC